MKKALVAIAALFVSLSAFAQGQVVFNTHDTSVAPPIDARVLNPDGTPATAGFGELVIVQPGGALSPLNTASPAAFKTSVNGAGYINAGAATATGFPNGTSVQIILRAWQGAAGSTFDTATVKGQSAPITVVLREAPTPPDGLTGLSGFTMTGSIPEPTTLALGALGLGGAFLIRRRK